MGDLSFRPSADLSGQLSIRASGVGETSCRSALLHQDCVLGSYPDPTTPHVADLQDATPRVADPPNATPSVADPSDAATGQPMSSRVLCLPWVSDLAAQQPAPDEPCLNSAPLPHPSFSPFGPVLSGPHLPMSGQLHQLQPVLIRRSPRLAAKNRGFKSKSSLLRAQEVFCNKHNSAMLATPASAITAPTSSTLPTSAPALATSAAQPLLCSSAASGTCDHEHLLPPSIEDEGIPPHPPHPLSFPSQRDAPEPSRCSSLPLTPFEIKSILTSCGISDSKLGPSTSQAPPIPVSAEGGTSSGRR